VRILVLGAYGLVGSFVLSRLLADGHQVIGVGRDTAAALRRVPGAHWVQLDLQAATVEDWTRLLVGVGAVVNCAGALQDGGRDHLHAVHVRAVERLTRACAAVGVSRFVQISAAGIDGGAATGFARTKLAAEKVLEASGLDWIILRPALVLGPSAFGGTALLRGLAGLPFVTPAVYPGSIVQVVSVHDVALAVASAVRPDAPARLSVDLAHSEALSLESLLVELRRWLGLPQARVIATPIVIARAAARLADGLAWLGWRSPMRTTSIEQLEAGVRADGAAAERELGLRLASLREMLDEWPCGVQERWFARAYFLKPASIAALAAFWFFSGLIGLTIGLGQSVRLLTVAGVEPTTAKVAVIAGAGADLVVAGALCFRRSASRALQAALALSAAYAIGGAFLRPDLWLDPLGPLLKILPASLLAAWLLATLDER